MIGRKLIMNRDRPLFRDAVELGEYIMPHCDQLVSLRYALVFRASAKEVAIRAEKKSVIREAQLEAGGGLVGKRASNSKGSCHFPANAGLSGQAPC